jgi:hypothetical protein
MYEDYPSRSNYGEMFIKFLKLCNYEIELLEDDRDKPKKTNSKYDINNVDIEERSYRELPMVDSFIIIYNYNFIL